MNNIIFRIVANLLWRMGRITGFTYNEINIIVYYFLIPFSWLFLLDSIFHFHYLKIGFIFYCLGFRMGCRDFRSYSDRLFDQSAAFLNYFNKFGSNYVASSVWICVAIPVVIYGVLIYFALQ
jgi:hypothetical protein